MALAEFPRHRFSVEEYRRMGDVGLLSPDDRVELIEGEIADMSPIGRVHAAVGVLAVEADPELQPARRPPHRLDVHLVAPRVAEVVLVGEPSCGPHGAEHGHGLLVELIVRIVIELHAEPAPPMSKLCRW
jgi:hypothetical protein